MIASPMPSAPEDPDRPLRVLRVLTRPNLGGPTRQAIALWHAHAAQGADADTWDEASGESEGELHEYCGEDEAEHMEDDQADRTQRQPIGECNKHTKCMHATLTRTHAPTHATLTRTHAATHARNTHTHARNTHTHTRTHACTHQYTTRPTHTLTLKCSTYTCMRTHQALTDTYTTR